MGTLRGFDEYVNMVLDDVTEIEITATGRKEVSISLQKREQRKDLMGFFRPFFCGLPV